MLAAAVGLALLTGIAPYDDAVARRCALLSSAAYSPVDQIGNWTFPNYACELSDFQVEAVYAAPSKSAYGYVGVDHQQGAIVAAFQGTVDRVDWITNLSTWLRYGHECIVGDNTTTAAEQGTSTTNGTSLGFVHRGFCDYYKVLAEQGLPEQVLQLARQYRGYNIVYTGHSLGGAAATVGVVDLGVRYQVPRERLLLYTFGTPRPGDAAFGELFNQSVGTAYRVVHNRDIVPHLAPCCHEAIWGGGCGTGQTCPFHAAQQVWYHNDMAPGQNYMLCGTTGEDQICDQIINLSVADHEFYFGMQVNTTAATQAAMAQAAAAQVTLEQNGALARARASLPAEMGMGISDAKSYQDIITQAAIAR